MRPHSGQSDESVQQLAALGHSAPIAVDVLDAAFAALARWRHEHDGWLGWRRRRLGAELLEFAGAHRPLLSLLCLRDEQRVARRRLLVALVLGEHEPAAHELSLVGEQAQGPRGVRSDRHRRALRRGQHARTARRQPAAVRARHLQRVLRQRRLSGHLGHIQRHAHRRLILIANKRDQHVCGKFQVSRMTSKQ